MVYLESPYLNVVSFELEYVGFLLSGQMSMPKRLPEQLFSSVFFFKCEILKRTEIVVN